MSVTRSFSRDALASEIPFLRAYARMLCGNRDAADDVVQSALLAAWEHRASLRDQTLLRPWLLQIVRNAHRSLARRRAREDAALQRHGDERASDGPATSLSVDCDEVGAALMQLAPVDREAIVLVMVQELGYAAAASVSGCPVGTLKSRISRARRKLRALLSPPNDRGRGSATSSKAKAA